MILEAAVARRDPASDERIVHYTCCDLDLLVAQRQRIYAFCGVELTGLPEVSDPVSCAECVRIVAWSPGCSACPRRWADSPPI